MSLDLLREEERMDLIKVKINDETNPEKVKLIFRVRLDFRAEEKSGRFFFGGKTSEAMAEDVRNEQMTLLKNVPLQGITFDSFDDKMDIYRVLEGDNKKKQEVAYAPLVVTFKTDGIEHVFPLLHNPAFKKIEIISPENMSINKLELERLLFLISKR